MAIAKLSIDLEARLANLQAGLDKAGLLAERQAERINGAFNGIARVGVGLGAVLAGAFSAAGITAFVRSTVDGLDALNDFADATGTTIELASALEDVAARTGTSFETVQSAVLKLNKVLSDAKPGTEAANVLKLIGLNAEELKRLDPAEALRATAVALAGFADDGNKARITQELLGKSTAEVAPLLKDLAESGQLNATVTAEQAKQAEEFNKQLFEMQKNVVDVSRTIAGPLISALNQFFDAVRGRGVGGSSPISDLLVVPLQTVTVIGANVAFVLRGIGTEIGGIAAQAAAFLSGDFSGARTIGEFMREDAKAARLEFDQLEKRLMAIGRVLPQADYSNEGRRGPLPRLGVLSAGPGQGGKGGGKSSSNFVGPMLDDATLNAIKALENTDVARISALREQLQSLISIRGSVSDTSRIDEALEKTVEHITKLDPAAQAAAASADKLKRILASTPSGQLASVLDDIALVNAELGNDENYEKWAEAMRTVTARLGSQTEAELDTISTFAEQAGRNIQDALGSSLEQALTGNFENIGELWRNLLVRMAAQAAAAQLNQFLFGETFGTKGGSLGGVVGSLFAGTLFGGARADGGPVSAGRAYLVGERGAEIMVPRSAGTVLPNGVGMGGVTINQYQTVNVGQGVSRGEVYAAIQQANAAGKADILQTLFRTGRGAYA
jgi:hypothetical protein